MAETRTADHHAEREHRQDTDHHRDPAGGLSRRSKPGTAVVPTGSGVLAAELPRSGRFVTVDDEGLTVGWARVIVA